MAKKQLLNEQAGQILAAVRTLQVVKSSPLFKLKLAGIAAVLTPVCERISEVLKELQLEYVEKDVAGKPVPRVIGGKPIDGTVVYTDLAAYEAEYQKVLQGTCDVDVDEITRAEIEALPDFEGSIEGILPLLAS